MNRAHSWGFIAAVCVAAAVALSATAVVFGGDESPSPKHARPKQVSRPLVTVEPPRRELGVTMDFNRSPNVVVTTPGLDSGLAPGRVFTTFRFSIDGVLVKVRTEPPYTITNLRAGQHILTVTGTASGGDYGRIQESYVK